MIGHVFASSGATCLALAPSAERPDEYILVARTETGYAIANILASDLGKIGGPTSWMRASYVDAGSPSNTREDMLTAARWNAAVQFTDMTLGIQVTSALSNKVLTERLNVLVGAIEHAEQVAEHRAHLATAGA